MHKKINLEEVKMIIIISLLCDFDVRFDSSVICLEICIRCGLIQEEKQLHRLLPLASRWRESAIHEHERSCSLSCRLGFAEQRHGFWVYCV